MSLKLLQIFNARNLKEFTLSPHPSYTILYGVNGAGKTTILESIYLLLRSKTFRSIKYKKFINHNSSSCTVFSKFFHDGKESLSNTFTLGITRSKNSTQPVIHLNSEKVNSLSTISNLVILGLITPQSFSLIDAGPSIRRKFLDWGVFHVEPHFLSDWKSHKKVLINRNTLLKKLNRQYSSIERIPEKIIHDLYCWTPQLILYNNKLNEQRSLQLDNLNIIFSKYLKLFSFDLFEKISLSYFTGWKRDILYEKYINGSFNEDFAAGYTRHGTHYADIQILYETSLAKDILSRGQKKIVVICMILAQYSFLIHKGLDNDNKISLLLLDDIDSELDINNLKILFKILNNLKTQVILTTTNIDKYDFINRDLVKLFHVEQ